ERFRLESGTAAGGAGLGELVLAQEHPDVLLVALRLEPLEEREHAEESPPRPVEQKVAGVAVQVAPRGVQRDALRPRGLAQDAAPALVARLGPGVERAAREALAGVGDDQRLVVLEHRAEAVAPRACPPRIVERKQDRRERRRRRAAAGARRVRGKAPAVAVLERHRDALAFAEG